MVGNCLECLKPGLSLSDFKAGADLISFLQWQHVEKKIVKVNQNGKCEQVVSYNKQKDELKTGEALIHVNYSQSHNNTQQDEIQSAYFRQKNFSIFTSGS